jgi:Organic solute transporter Ostalpha
MDLGRYSRENLSLAIQDSLLCFEMPLFALLHLYAFSHRDYISDDHLYSGRLPFYHALRDSLLGFRDVLEDSRTTFRGTGFSYRTFEPAEGGVHQGLGRERRVKAGLRYSKGGEKKYWLPMPGETTDAAYGRKGPRMYDSVRRPAGTTRKLLIDRINRRDGYAPLDPESSARVVTRGYSDDHHDGADSADAYSDDSGLSFGTPQDDDEMLFEDSRKLEFGDYNYPCVDASQEEAKRRMRQEEDAFIYGGSRKAANKGKGRETKTSPLDTIVRSVVPVASAGRRRDSTSLAPDADNQGKASPPSSIPTTLPDGCVDLVVEDMRAEEERASHERHKGEPHLRAGKPTRVYRRTYSSPPLSPSQTDRPSSPFLRTAAYDVPQAREEDTVDGDGGGDQLGLSSSIVEKPDVFISREAEAPPAHATRNTFVGSEDEDSPWK